MSNLVEELFGELQVHLWTLGLRSRPIWAAFESGPTMLTCTMCCDSSLNAFGFQTTQRLRDL